MKWVSDRTGRFHQRPHYEPEELNAECEMLVREFLVARYGQITYPISTDDLTVLIESHVSDLDLYADLSDEEGEVEGVTDFVRGRKPRVRISKRLTTDPRMENRLRTTLTHELGHVRFHTFMFEVERPPSLFTVSDGDRNKCKRDSIIGARQTDWMEWQAGFACGAILMPVTELTSLLSSEVNLQSPSLARLSVNSPEASRLIETVTRKFQVSRDAARVRLLQRGVLSDSQAAGYLF